MSANEIRTLPYEVRIADNAHYYVHLYYWGVRHPRSGWFYLFMIAGVPALISYSDLAQGRYSRFALSLIGFAFLWLVIIPALGVMSALSTARKSPTAKGVRVTTLTANDVTTTGDSFTTRQNWAAFRDIRRSGKRLYLVTQAYAAFVIPFNAFATSQDADVFLLEAKRHIANANHKQIGAFYEDSETSHELPGLRSGPFRLTFGRYMLYSVPAVLRSFLRPGTLIICFAAFIALPLWLFRAKIMAGNWSPLLASLSFAAYFVVVFSPLISAVSWWMNRKKVTFQGERVVSITPECLYMRGAQQDLVVRWSDVLRCTSVFGFMTFWTGPQGGIFAPSSAFADATEAKTFYEQACTYWKAAKTAK